MTRFFRRIFTWKFAFYEVFLPALRLLGPRAYDRLLGIAGWGVTRLWPGRTTFLVSALQRAAEHVDLPAEPEALWPELAANSARFLARDFVLDVASNASFFERFEVRGQEHLRRALADGRGAILVGSHMGAYISGLHWLFRSGFPVRALVQRPCHVSRRLSALFDSDSGPSPQSRLFLRRDLPGSVGVEKTVQAHAALRDGLAIYMCGDVPWQGPNTRPGRLLGQTQRFLSIWTDLAVLTRAPVFHVFCTHLPGGRFELHIDAVGRIQPGEENEALADYFKHLEGCIASHPTQAVAHLLWPCFGPGVAARDNSQIAPQGGSRPGRRAVARYQ